MKVKSYKVQMATTVNVSSPLTRKRGEEQLAHSKRQLFGTLFGWGPRWLGGRWNVLRCVENLSESAHLPFPWELAMNRIVFTQHITAPWSKTGRTAYPTSSVRPATLHPEWPSDSRISSSVAPANLNPRPQLRHCWPHADFFSIQIWEYQR